jgi:hypothetical protein
MTSTLQTLLHQWITDGIGSGRPQQPISGAGEMPDGLPLIQV